MTRDVLNRMNDAAVVALRCKGDAWPRTLLRDTPIPDGWIALHITPDGRRRFVPSGETPRLEREDTLVLVRNRPLVVPVQVRETPSAADHLIDGTVELLVRCPARDDDLAAFSSGLLQDAELTSAALAEAFRQGGAQQLLQRYVGEHAALTLVREEQREKLLAYFQKELQRLLFSSGLVLERLGRVEFDSPSLVEHESLQRATARRVSELEARSMVESAAMAAAQRRLDDLGSILGKLKHAADADGALRWRELLPTLTPGERGRLLESLWRLTPDRTAAHAVVVVAGADCAWLDPRDPSAIVRRITLPDDLGGLRSVSAHGPSRTLLIGAARGVWQLRAADGQIEQQYPARVAGAPPQTGFNAATIAGDRLYATHSQLGAWSWKVGQPADAHALLQPIGGVPKTIRAVTADSGGRILLACDNRVHAYSASDELLWESEPTDGSIYCLAVLEPYVFAGTGSGALVRTSLALPGEWLVVYRGLAAIESVHARRWDDLIEVVVPAGAQGVCGVYAEEGIVSRLLPTTQAARRAWACDDALVALNEPRDRLYLLHSTMHERTGVEAPLARMLGRAIQDVCIVTGTAP